MIYLFYIAPEEALSNVRLERLLNNEILVTWDLLPDMYANGEIRRYIVSYREYKNHYQWHDDGEEGKSINVSSSENQLVLSGLDGGRKYQFAVRAYTVDFGPRSEWETIMVGKYAILHSYFIQIRVNTNRCVRFYIMPYHSLQPN